jgi:hypothetical protein
MEAFDVMQVPVCGTKLERSYVHRCELCGTYVRRFEKVVDIGKRLVDQQKERSCSARRHDFLLSREICFLIEHKHTHQPKALNKTGSK